MLIQSRFDPIAVPTGLKAGYLRVHRINKGKRRLSDCELITRAHLIYKGDADYSLPLVLLAVQVRGEVTRVEVKDGRIDVDHQALTRRKKGSSHIIPTVILNRIRDATAKKFNQIFNTTV